MIDQRELEITDGEFDDMRKLAKTNSGMRELLEKALAYSKLIGPPVIDPLSTNELKDLFLKSLREELSEDRKKKKHSL